MYTRLALFYLLAFGVRIEASMNFESESAYTSNKAEDLRMTYQVRLACSVCSAISLCASVIGFYWFFRMDKRFRHRLIMILLYGDLIRGFWYFTMAIYSFKRGAPQTKTAMCQVSGFFIQYATETSDYGVLVIAVHSALQVFRPASRGKSDGLHHYRYYIYAGALILPAIMASLAFIHSEWGYLLQGAYCTLPIRPFWYLLALAWIPRYLIVLTILGLAVAIYAYVGFEFKSYENISQSLKTPMSVTQSGGRGVERDMELADAMPELDRSEQDTDRRASSIAHEILSSPRRISVTVLDGPKTTSAPESRANMPTLPIDAYRPLHSAPGNTFLFREPSKDTFTSYSGFSQSPHRVRTTASDAILTMASAPAHLGNDPASSREASPMSPAQRNLLRQRRRIYRQLRLQFVYPIVYTLMYLVPFVNHCLQYSDRFAAHPIFALRMTAMIFLNSLGLVDCLIFSIREKPWRSIPSSNGTLWGSFTIWDNLRSSHDGSLALGLKEGLKANFSAKGLTDSRGFGRIRSSVRTSASDNDQTRIAAEQARLRLELEKQERLRAFKEKVGVGEEKRPSLGEPGTTTRHVVQLKDFEKKEGAGTVNKGKGKAQ